MPHGELSILGYLDELELDWSSSRPDSRAPTCSRTPTICFPLTKGCSSSKPQSRTGIVNWIGRWKWEEGEEKRCFGWIQAGQVKFQGPERTCRWDPYVTSGYALATVKSESPGTIEWMHPKFSSVGQNLQLHSHTQVANTICVITPLGKTEVQ
jgi:hypothetical protein